MSYMILDLKKKKEKKAKLYVYKLNVFIDGERQIFFLVDKRPVYCFFSIKSSLDTQTRFWVSRLGYGEWNRP